MAKRCGYIKLYRALSASALWTKEPFSRGQAWVDLLMLARFEPGYMRVHGTRIDLKRGQVGWSILKLSLRWKWSRGKVERFLNELENDQRIEQQKNHLTSVLTITNYDRYQKTGNEQSNRQSNRRATDDATDGQLMMQQTGTKEEGIKKDIRRKNKNTMPALPEILDAAEFRQSLADWLAYHKPYKAAGLKALISRAAHLAEIHGVAAVCSAMVRAMANGWQGWDHEASFKQQPRTAVDIGDAWLARELAKETKHVG